MFRSHYFHSRSLRFRLRLALLLFFLSLNLLFLIPHPFYFSFSFSKHNDQDFLLSGETTQPWDPSTPNPVIIHLKHLDSQPGELELDSNLLNIQNATKTGTSENTCQWHTGSQAHCKFFISDKRSLLTIISLLLRSRYPLQTQITFRCSSPPISPLTDKFNFSIGIPFLRQIKSLLIVSIGTSLLFLLPEQYLKYLKQLFPLILKKIFHLS